MGDLENNINELLNKPSPIDKAVSALVDIKDARKDNTEVEVKTDLTEEDVCLHAATQVIDRMISMSPEEWKKASVVEEFIEKKERKLLSLGRKSREEIVRVAQQPDTINQEVGTQGGGFVRRLFSARRPQ